MDKHTKFPAHTGGLGREPVYQGLRRCGGMSSSWSTPPARKRLTSSSGFLRIVLCADSFASSSVGTITLIAVLLALVLTDTVAGIVTAIILFGAWIAVGWTDRDISERRVNAAQSGSDRPGTVCRAPGSPPRAAQEPSTQNSAVFREKGTAALHRTISRVAHRYAQAIRVSQAVANSQPPTMSPNQCTPR